MVHWQIEVSEETNAAMHSFLEEEGMKEEDLSKFVEEAVRWRMLDLTVQEVKDCHRDIPLQVLASKIDQEVREVRAERYKASNAC